MMSDNGEVKPTWQKQKQKSKLKLRPQSLPRKPKAKAKARAAEVAAAVYVPLPGTEASRGLCEKVSQISSGTCLLGFSRGKDAIASWLYLRQFFHTIIPFHCASVPHLSFVDKSLDYYERLFDTKIIRCFSGEVSKAISDLVYQPMEDEEAIDALDLWEYDNHIIIDVIKADLKLPHIWTAFGINASDSIDRRIYVNKYQGKIDSHKTFYPCFDWSRKQIMEAIDMAHIPLAGDYLLANRSLAGVPNYRHLLRMSEVFPEDMERVEALFPFARAQLARNEFREEKYERTKTNTHKTKTTDGESR